MKNEQMLVFLSRPNPFLESQSIFLTKLQALLKKNNIVTSTLQADNYDLTDSFNHLKGMIKQCYGVLVIGFKQIFIDVGAKKKGGQDNSSFFKPGETNVSNKALTSPFCHIEGTIGLLNDLPLMIINEKGVIEEGIIQGGRFSVKLENFDLDNMDQFFDNDIVMKQLSVWIGKVANYYLFLNGKKT